MLESLSACFKTKLSEQLTFILWTEWLLVGAFYFALVTNCFWLCQTFSPFLFPYASSEKFTFYIFEELQKSV